MSAAAFVACDAASAPNDDALVGGVDATVPAEAGGEDGTPGGVCDPACPTGEHCDEGRCVDGPVAIDWVRLDGGTFLMGDAEYHGMWTTAHPSHEVTVSAFEIARTETTVAQYRVCVDAGLCTPPHTGEWDCNWDHPERDDHPVDCVDWHQAAKFSRWLGGHLPTEAEWEYAARSAGTPWKYPWGDDDATCDEAVVDPWYEIGPGCGESRSWPVCSKSPAGDTSQGLCDMAGNAYEWTKDWMGDYPTGPVTDPIGPESGSRRVLRGGSWQLEPHEVTAFRRNAATPNISYAGVGFRPARPVE